jgi:hypothetical protein
MLVLSQVSLADAPLLTRIIRDGKAHWGCPAGWLSVWKDELRITPELVATWHLRTAAF